jgi:hypothetical protein
MFAVPLMDVAVREVEALGLDPERFRAFYEDALPRIYGYFLHRCYGLSVTQTRAHHLIELANKEGTTATGSVSTTLRVVPGKRVRGVQLRLSGSDPIGNQVSLVRSLKLPR